MTEQKKQFDSFPFENKLYETEDGVTFNAKILKVDKDFLWQWIKQKIDEACFETSKHYEKKIVEACKKQREICADAYLKRTVWDIDVGSVIDLIKNAPSPKESDNGK